MLHSFSTGFQIAAPSGEFAKIMSLFQMETTFSLSGGASKVFLIQPKEVVLSVEYIMSGSLYACSYDDKWYFVVANYISA